MLTYFITALGFVAAQKTVTAPSFHKKVQALVQAGTPLSAGHPSVQQILAPLLPAGHPNVDTLMKAPKANALPSGHPNLDTYVIVGNAAPTATTAGGKAPSSGSAPAATSTTKSSALNFAPGVCLMVVPFLL